MRLEKALTVMTLLIVIVLTGCSLKPGPEIKPQEKATQGQSPQAAPKTDPAKEAESEKYFRTGLELYEQYKYQDAVANFDKAIAASPDNYKVYTAKGIALCFEGDYKTGISLIQRTLEMKPGYVPAFYDMAMAYKLQNDYDKSLYWFGKTIEGDPQNTWSYYGIATIYADRGDARNSLAYLKKAIELDKSVKEVARQQAHFDQMRGMAEFRVLVH